MISQSLSSVANLTQCATSDSVEALSLRDRQEKERDDGLEQLKQKLRHAAAEATGENLLDGDEAFNELRQLIEEQRREQTAK